MRAHSAHHYKGRDVKGLMIDVCSWFADNFSDHLGTSWPTIEQVLTEKTPRVKGLINSVRERALSCLDATDDDGHQQGRARAEYDDVVLCFS